MILRSDEVLKEILFNILEFALINQQFFINRLKMNTALCKC